MLPPFFEAMAYLSSVWTVVFHSDHDTWKMPINMYPLAVSIVCFWESWQNVLLLWDQFKSLPQSVVDRSLLAELELKSRLATLYLEEVMLYGP